MSRFAILCAFALVGCQAAEGGADDQPQLPADTGRVTFDAWEPDAIDATSDTSVADTAKPDTMVLDVVPEVDPHACPTSATPQDCSKGSGTGEADQCHDGPSCYLAKVQKAVNNQVATHPDWFDTSGTCPVILKLDLFLDAVVAQLVADGYCAIRDPNAPGEEITVKRDNAFAESFDIVASTGCARSGAGIYTGYCAPAWW